MNNLPGFTGEASLYKSSGLYLAGVSNKQPSIIPQRIFSGVSRRFFPGLLWPGPLGCIPNCLCVQDTPENPCPCCGYGDWGGIFGDWLRI